VPTESNVLIQQKGVKDSPRLGIEKVVENPHKTQPLVPKPLQKSDSDLARELMNEQKKELAQVEDAAEKNELEKKRK